MKCNNGYIHYNCFPRHVNTSRLLITPPRTALGALLLTDNGKLKRYAEEVSANNLIRFAVPYFQAC